MKKISFCILLLVIIMGLQTNLANAHPGRTDSSGCHTCRTNCPNWGLSYGEYHCHGGSTVKTTQSKTTSDDTNWFNWLLGIGTVSVIGYYIIKHKK